MNEGQGSWECVYTLFLSERYSAISWVVILISSAKASAWICSISVSFISVTSKCKLCKSWFFWSFRFLRNTDFYRNRWLFFRLFIHELVPAETVFPAPCNIMCNQDLAQFQVIDIQSKVLSLNTAEMFAITIRYSKTPPFVSNKTIKWNAADGA